MKTRPKTHEDELREKIPTIDDVPTLYRPMQDYLMIVPLPEQTKIGEIILPDRARIIYQEGHIVAQGPYCYHGEASEKAGLSFSLGDCVTWSPHDELKFKEGDSNFVIVKASLILMRIPVKMLKSWTDQDSHELVQAT